MGRCRYCNQGFQDVSAHERACGEGYGAAKHALKPVIYRCLTCNLASNNFAELQEHSRTCNDVMRVSSTNAPVMERLDRIEQTMKEILWRLEKK